MPPTTVISKVASRQIDWKSHRFFTSMTYNIVAKHNSQDKVQKSRETNSNHTGVASLSPSRAVTNPNTILPAVIPSQKPIDVIPLGNGSASLTSLMRVTIHPPIETSTPTYRSNRNAQIHDTRAAGRLKRASFSPAPFESSAASM